MIPKPGGGVRPAVVGDAKMTAAPLDRLTHQSPMIEETNFTNAEADHHSPVRYEEIDRLFSDRLSHATVQC